MKDWLEMALTGCTVVMTAVTAIVIFMTVLAWTIIEWLIRVIYFFSPFLILIILCGFYWLLLRL